MLSYAALYRDATIFVLTPSIRCSVRGLWPDLPGGRCIRSASDWVTWLWRRRRHHRRARRATSFLRSRRSRSRRAFARCSRTPDWLESLGARGQEHARSFAVGSCRRRATWMSTTPRSDGRAILDRVRNFSNRPFVRDVGILQIGALFAAGHRLRCLNCARTDARSGAIRHICAGRVHRNHRRTPTSPWARLRGHNTPFSRGRCGRCSRLLGKRFPTSWQSACGPRSSSSHRDGRSPTRHGALYGTRGSESFAPLSAARELGGHRRDDRLALQCTSKIKELAWLETDRAPCWRCPEICGRRYG